MEKDSHSMSLAEVARQFLLILPPGERGSSQQAVYGFVRWFGNDRPLDRLSPPEIAGYAERLSRSDADHTRKLKLLRAFLTYAKKEGWTAANLSTHLKVKRGSAPGQVPPRRSASQPVPLTQQGYNKLEAELAVLRGKRHEVIEEVRLAAADKDFRENAPLEAARQHHGQIEGRIRELEHAMKSATIIDEERKTTPKAGIGDTVILHDLASGEELRYTLVSPREVDPLKGKISTVSPIGKAIAGRQAGEQMEVATPSGKHRYRISKVEH